MKFIKAILFVFVTLLSLNVAARETVAVINYENLVVATNSGTPPQIDQVKQAIQVGAGAKGWSITSQPDDKLLATINVRGKHNVVVEITYAADKYSLHYKDSTNMKYGERDGQMVIHPAYNKWVQGLKDSIRIELLKL